MPVFDAHDTPATRPDTTVTLAFSVPDDSAWIAVILAALYRLTDADSWRPGDGLTEEQSAAAMQEIIDSYTVT